MNTEELAKDLTVAVISRLNFSLEDKALGMKIAKLYRSVLQSLQPKEPSDAEQIASSQSTGNDTEITYNYKTLKKLSKEEIKEQFEALSRALK